jgi:hypothetical protein
MFETKHTVSFCIVLTVCNIKLNIGVKQCDEQQNPLVVGTVVGCDIMLSCREGPAAFIRVADGGSKFLCNMGTSPSHSVVSHPLRLILLLHWLYIGQGETAFVWCEVGIFNSFYVFACE